MMDIKINGNTYNDVERVRLVRADGLGVYQLDDATIIDAHITGDYWEGEYYNSVVTKIGRTWSLMKIKKINLPNVTTAVANAFYSQSSTIVEARLTGLVSSNHGLFLNAQQLTKAVFGKNLSALGTQSFRACGKLTTLVLPYEGVVTIDTSTTNGTFTDSGIAKGTGYVYVPSSQVENYKANSSWSTYANQIRAIEDYPDEVA